MLQIVFNPLTPEFFYPGLKSANQKLLFFAEHTFSPWTWRRKEKLQTTIGNLKRKLPIILFFETSNSSSGLVSSSIMKRSKHRSKSSKFAPIVNNESIPVISGIKIYWLWLTLVTLATTMSQLFLFIIPIISGIKKPALKG
jgi:hypothetical protein